MKRSASAWRAAVAALSLWVLWAHVYAEFQRVRLILVGQPTATRQAFILPLAGMASISSSELVLIYRVRNTGTTPVEIAARVGGRVVQRSSVPPRSSVRIDVAWPRPLSIPHDYEAELAGDGSWTLEYAEAANLHGFTRGVIDFLILPEHQSFARPPFAILLLCGLGLLFAVATPTAPFRARRIRILHGTLSATTILLFLAAAVSPLVSPFRIVLAPHTFVAGLLIMYAPDVLRLLTTTARGSARARRMAIQSVEARVPTLGRVLAGVSVRTWAALVLAGTLAAYALVLVRYAGPAAGGADSSGYLNSARLLAAGRISTPMRTLDTLPPEPSLAQLYMPLGFVTADIDRLVPLYPIGLPLLIAGFSHVVGRDAAALSVIVLHALAGVALVVWLARLCGLSAGATAVAALMLATSPLYLFMALFVMSDVAALVWTTLAVVLAWISRERPVRALAAGFVFSMAVLTRPANLIAIVPVAICLGANPVRWAWLVLGGLPGAVVLIGYNVAAYGSALTTGYGNAGPWFAFANVVPSLRNYAAWLPVVITPVGLLAAGLPALSRHTPRLARVLFLWIAAFAGFYAFLYFTHETWWNLRFLLPAFPACIVGGLWVGTVLVDRWPFLRPRHVPGGLVGWALLAVVLLLFNVRWYGSLNVLYAGAHETTYIEATDWVKTHVPPKSAILAMQVSGSFFYYTDLPVLRWDLITEPAWERLQDDATTGELPLYAVFFPYEMSERKAFDRVPGRWRQVGAIQHITVWKFEGRTAR